MQRLNTLWQMANAASSVRDFTQESRVYTFQVDPLVTFYLQADNTEVHVKRWERPMIEVKTTLQAPFGWRVVTDQDDVGVYVVARRRAVVGGLSSARFTVVVPRAAYLILKLAEGALKLDNINGTLRIPPPE